MPSENDKSSASTEPRKGTPSPRLDEAEFRRRFFSQYQEPPSARARGSSTGSRAAAWDAYSHQRKSPRTRKAGPEFHDPEYELVVDWIAAREAIKAAEARHDDPRGNSRFLLISGSSRCERTCPGEMSISYRLVEIAR
jgi:hypothetical protein